jgi:hypothetical protein
MSVAVHLFIAEKFSEESYREFLRDAQSLFGNWNLEGFVDFNNDLNYPTIHECWIQAQDISQVDWFRVNVQAERHLKQTPVWPFEYEWALSFESSAGRSALGFAVQLGAWLLAMHRFDCTHAFDHDTCLKNEPEEFRTTEALTQHIRRLMIEELQVVEELKERKIVNADGFLLLPLNMT